MMKIFAKNHKILFFKVSKLQKIAKIKKHTKTKQQHRFQL
jgi:hypothetical protein